MHTRDRRKEERRILEIPLCSDVTIDSIHEKGVSCGTTEICIKDLSIHGLRFVSSLRFPVNSNLLLRFQTRIMDNLITLNGTIVWRRATAQGDGYEYGVQLLHDEFSRLLFTKLVNDMSVWLKKVPFVPGCRFCSSESCPLSYQSKQKT